jgi:cardiolipin synthase
LHFRIRGPLVAQMLVPFVEDWSFTTGELLDGEAWAPAAAPAGSVVARGILDGPDENFETVRWAILGALAQAARSVTIVTPYFLPDQAIATALRVATLRGVRVEIALPAVNNLRFVQWASTAQLWQVLEYGCVVRVTAGSFDHSKVMLVDDGWAMIGSANWDARSLRLNFEFNVECYDPDLVASLARIVAHKLRGAHELSLADLDARPLPIKLRDGAARLFAPYL